MGPISAKNELHDITVIESGRDRERERENERELSQKGSVQIKDLILDIWEG